MSEGTWRDNYIRDGFVQPGYLEEIEGLHGEIRFSYKPMIPEKADEIDRQVKALRERGEPSKASRLESKTIADQLTDWDLKVAPSESACRRLRNPLLRTKLYLIVIGARPSDVDPDWMPSDEANEEFGTDMPDDPSALEARVGN